MNLSFCPCNDTLHCQLMNLTAKKPFTDFTLYFSSSPQTTALYFCLVFLHTYLIFSIFKLDFIAWFGSCWWILKSNLSRFIVVYVVIKPVFI